MRKSNPEIRADREMKEFLEWEENVTILNDSIIKENIKYDKYISLIKNSILLDYLNNRFVDSTSLLESYQRIKMGIYEKPKCLECGKPVNWIGKPSRPYTKYCCVHCSGTSKHRLKAMEETLIRNWGSKECFNSPIYREHLKKKIGRETWATPESIEKRKQTFEKNWGTSKISEISEILEKQKATTMERYGVPYAMLNEEYKQNHLKKIAKTYKAGTSKEEIKLKEELEKIFPSLIWQYTSVDYPFLCDFYIPEKDLYIEYQGSQYHNYSPYIGNNKQIQELNSLIEKAKSKPLNKKGTNMYYKIIETWTVADPNKRNYVKRNNLNWIEIWRNYKIEDVVNKINEFSNIKIKIPNI